MHNLKNILLVSYKKLLCMECLFRKPFGNISNGLSIRSTQCFPGQCLHLLFSSQRASVSMFFLSVVSFRVTEHYLDLASSNSVQFWLCWQMLHSHRRLLENMRQFSHHIHQYATIDGWYCLSSRLSCCHTAWSTEMFDRHSLNGLNSEISGTPSPVSLWVLNGLARQKQVVLPSSGYTNVHQKL